MRTQRPRGRLSSDAGGTCTRRGRAGGGHARRTRAGDARTRLGRTEGARMPRRAGCDQNLHMHHQGTDPPRSHSRRFVR